MLNLNNEIKERKNQISKVGLQQQPIMFLYREGTIHQPNLFMSPQLEKCRNFNFHFYHFPKCAKTIKVFTRKLSLCAIPIFPSYKLSLKRVYKGFKINKNSVKLKYSKN